MWDICIAFMCGEEYIQSLYDLFKRHSMKTVLDCGGGTGFPSIELKKKGIDISYCDNNELMYNNFQSKLKKLEIDMPHYFSDWLDLSKKIPKKFDVLICRGNSLIYVDSWNQDKKELNKAHIKKTLQEFFKVTASGGFLYVDLPNKKEFDQKYPLLEEFGEKIIDGKKVKLTWQLNHDYERKLRACKITIFINNEKHEFLNYSYLLRHEELIKFLKESGFKKVEPILLKGETYYASFLAWKE